MQTNLSRTHRLVLMALFLALNIILSRFLSIAAWNIKIGFAFLPIALSGMLLGPLPTAIVAAAGDFLGATLFPIYAYFPGFTATAFLTGLLYGFFLHNKSSMKNIFLAVLSTELIGSLLLNTLWISMLYGTPFWALLLPRAVQVCVMIVVELVVIRILAGYLPRFQLLQRA